MAMLHLFGISVPACLLLIGSIVLFLKGRTMSSSLQLLGAGGLAPMVLTHFAEASLWSRGCIGGWRIVQVITSIWEALHSL